jgi:uncharacterized phiE125 gp8 family phage protein
MGLKLITAPTSEPVTLAEARTALRLDADNTADDGHIEAVLIPAARAVAEQETGIALMERELELGLDEFPCHGSISLLTAPLIALESVKYYDTAGQLQTLDAANYLVDDHCEPPAVDLAPNCSWPATQCRANAVLVLFTAGHADAADVPKNVTAFMLAHIQAAYRGEDLSPYVYRVLDASKVYP